MNITLNPECGYKLPIKNGYLDIRVSDDPNYPGLDIEYIDNDEQDSYDVLTRPRVLIECPNDTSELRALIWDNPDSEDYNTEIGFKTVSDK